MIHLHPLSSASPTDLVNIYNNTLSACLYQLAPIKTRSVSFTHTAPWYSPELRQMKTRKRQLEHLANKTRLSVHTTAHKDNILQYKDALNTARSTYYSSLIHSDAKNPKTLFSTINKLLKPMDNASHSFSSDKCNAFLSFFQAKIDTIYNQLATSTSTSTKPKPSICHSSTNRPVTHPVLPDHSL